MTDESNGRSDNKILLTEIFRSPLQVGAICPSSKYLAKRMAASIDLEADGFVVELGAGTGVITESLMQRGVPPDRLIVIEKSASLAHHLARRFPDVRVLHSDAAEIPSIIASQEKVKAVVSSLPLRSLPKSHVARISHAWAQALAAKGRVIQFTYAPFSAPAWLHAGLQRTAHGTEWANMPPALVEVFSKA